MKELLQTLSIQEICLYLVMFCVAIKSIVDFIDWMKEKYHSKFNKDYDMAEREKRMSGRCDQLLEQHEHTIDICEELSNSISALEKTIEEIKEQLNQLTVSDMHDIKGWIVEKHHFLMKQQWVDDFTMDTIEKRFADYKAENGNSYVEGLMNELRSLPHSPNK
jgi:predicted RNase H-like nuclease (RuvC/YqgF family)